MKFHWFLSSLLSTLSVLLVSLSAQAAKLQTWQFNPAQNQLTFTTDEPVQPRVQLLANPARLVIDLPDTELERRRERDNLDGVYDEIQVRRMDDNLARIVIELENDYTLDPAQVTVQGTSPTTWIVQLPQAQRLPERRRNRDRGNDETGVPIAVVPYVEATTISAVTFNADGSGVTIQADRLLQDYTSGWDQTTASYQIRIPRARLARGLGSPTLDNRGPLLRLRLRQEGDAVVIGLQPAPGVQVGQIQVADQTLTVALLGRAQRRPAGTARSVPLPPLDQLPNVANQRVLVALDPGHGGPDPGAVGIGGLRETDIVLDVGLQVAALLQEHGAQVVMTRQDDRDVGLEPRVVIANRANADLFVSIHANAISMSRPDVNGVETYFYSSAAAEALAADIQASMLEATEMNSRGVKEARFYVLRRTAMPAALVEVGFVTGAIDAPQLADPAFREIIAKAITRGILQYVVENF